MRSSSNPQATLGGRFEIEREVARLGQGDVFGEVALLGGEPRNATIVASEPIDTYVLESADFKSAVERSPSIRDQLYRISFLRHR